MSKKNEKPQITEHVSIGMDFFDARQKRPLIVLYAWAPLRGTGQRPFHFYSSNYGHGRCMESSQSDIKVCSPLPQSGFRMEGMARSLDVRD